LDEIDIVGGMDVSAAMEHKNNIEKEAAWMP